MANKSYNIVVTTKKALNITLTDFTLSESWLVKILQKSVLTLAISESKKLVSNIINSGTGITVNKVNFYEYVSYTLSNGMSLLITVGESLKMVTAISQISSLLFIFKENLKASATITNFNFSTVFDPILASFFSLGDHDASTLGAMDIQTLEDLDYVAT